MQNAFYFFSLIGPKYLSVNHKNFISAQKIFISHPPKQSTDINELHKPTAGQSIIDKVWASKKNEMFVIELTSKKNIFFF